MEIQASSQASAFEVIHHNLHEFFMLTASHFHVNTADECDRLWVVDSGMVDLLGKPKKVQSPAVFIFNLNTNQLIRRFEIPEKQIKSESFFVNVVSFR